MSFIYFEVKIACRYKYLPTQLWHWLPHTNTLRQELVRSSSGAQSSQEKAGEACPAMRRSPGSSGELGGKIQKGDQRVQSFLNCHRHGPSNIFRLFVQNSHPVLLSLTGSCSCLLATGRQGAATLLSSGGKSSSQK